MPVLVVTGGSRGIGAAVARLGAQRGYDVAIGYANDAVAAAAIVTAVRSYDRRAFALRGDVGVEADVAKLFAAVDAEFGGPDAVVTNAGITGGFARIDALPAATLAAVLAVNVAGTVLCAREAIRRMSTRHGGRGGAIVTLSSVAARIGGGGDWVHYALSKGAIDTFTIGCAREVAGEGIRVNAVAPGLIETEIHAAAGDPERLARMGPGVPLGRTGTAEEVAEAALWLCSDAASYVTGTILDVAGGR